MPVVLSIWKRCEDAQNDAHHGAHRKPPSALDLSQGAWLAGCMADKTLPRCDLEAKMLGLWNGGSVSW